jgi:hypothetical protein
LGRAKWDGLRAPGLGKFEMTLLVLSRRTALRLVAAALVTVAVGLPVATAVAAPMGPGRHFRMDNGARPFDVDPDPCRPPGFRARGGGADCPNAPDRRWPRGRNGQRGPGSNAFGLQFDMGGY